MGEPGEDLDPLSELLDSFCDTPNLCDIATIIPDLSDWSTPPGFSLEPAASRQETVGHAGPSTSGRCLHSDHGHDCRVCTDAPAVTDSHLYELVDEKGQRSGVKIVRAQLKATPEWRSVAGKFDAAKAASAAGRERVVEALLRDNATILQVEDIFFLARTWGLRSSIWRRKSTQTLPETTERSALRGKRSSPDGEGDTLVVPSEDSLTISQLSECSHGGAASGSSGGVGAFVRGERHGHIALPMNRTAISPPVIDSPLTVLAIQQNVLPRFNDHSARIATMLVAREARAFCLNIGGAGVTVEKLSELRGVLATLRSAPGVFGPIRATNSARLLRLKEYGPQQAYKLGRAVPDPALQQHDLAWEVFNATVNERQKQNIAALNHQLALRTLAALPTGLEILDAVMLSAWREGNELRVSQLAVLWNVRITSGCSASLSIQDNSETHRGDMEVALLQQLAWVEDIIRVVAAQKQAAEGCPSEAPHPAPVIITAPNSPWHKRGGLPAPSVVLSLGRSPFTFNKP